MKTPEMLELCMYNIKKTGQILIPGKIFIFSEKTPMCLINELARYNKIQHQYRLTDEAGPAHKKTFTVCLKLGDVEEYIASGPSIKKAQHAAAAIALEKTKLKHPPPKTRLVKNSKYMEKIFKIAEVACNFHNYIYIFFLLKLI